MPMPANAVPSFTPSSRVAATAGIDPYAYLRDLLTRLPLNDQLASQGYHSEAWAKTSRPLQRRPLRSPTISVRVTAMASTIQAASRLPCNFLVHGGTQRGRPANQCATCCRNFLDKGLPRGWEIDGANRNVECRSKQILLASRLCGRRQT